MTGWARGVVGVGGAGGYLGLHAILGGLRADHGWFAVGGLAAWLALGARRAEVRAVAWFFIPLLIMGAVYDAQRYWADSLRGPIRVREPLAWELAWFGIDTAEGSVTPAHWWKSRSRPVFDAIAGAGYLLFIPAFLGCAAWWRFKERRLDGQQVMWALLALNLAGYATYLIYPAAPPWYVDSYGLGPAKLDALPDPAGTVRFDALFGVTWFAEYYSRNANVFGAIPSLHVGQTFLAVLFALRFRSLRVVTGSVWLVVTFGSVYFNHHYLVDGLVGMAFAVAAYAVAGAGRPGGRRAGGPEGRRAGRPGGRRAGGPEGRRAGRPEGRGLKS